jgi:hypothetical protein
MRALCSAENYGNRFDGGIIGPEQNHGMGGASLNWKRFVEKNTSGKSNNECRIFQKIDGNLMFVFAKKISTRDNLFGPFQCPPESKRSQKTSCTLET